MCVFNTIVLSHVNTPVLENAKKILFNCVMSLGDRFIAARKRANLSQQELALRLGCTQGLISKIERGDQNETALIVKVAQICGVNPFWLDSGEGEMVIEYLPQTNQQKMVLLAMQKMQPYDEDAMVKISHSLAEPTKHNGTQ